MSAHNASLPADAGPATDERPTGGRDVREDTHDDDGNRAANNPPTHGQVTNYPPAEFLEAVRLETVTDDGTRSGQLDTAAIRRRWLAYQGGEQASLDGWSR